MLIHDSLAEKQGKVGHAGGLTKFSASKQSNCSLFVFACKGYSIVSVREEGKKKCELLVVLVSMFVPWPYCSALVVFGSWEYPQ